MKVLFHLFLGILLILIFFSCQKKEIRIDTDTVVTPSPLPIIDVKVQNKSTLPIVEKEMGITDNLIFDEKIIRVKGVSGTKNAVIRVEASPTAPILSYLKPEEKITITGKTQSDDGLSDFQVTTGIIIEDYIRVRNKPHLEAAVIGMLIQGQKVEVIEQGTELMVIDHAKEFWYRIRNKEIPKGGWIFGKYLKRDPNRSHEWFQVQMALDQKGWIERKHIKLELQFNLDKEILQKDSKNKSISQHQTITFSQYLTTSQPINLKRTNFSSFAYDIKNIFEIEAHDFTEVNKLGRADDFKASMERLKQMDETPYTRFLIFQRPLLINSKAEWTGAGTEEVYTRFKRGLIDGTFWKALPPIISIGLTNTGFYTHLNSQHLCQKYNLNLNQDFFISELMHSGNVAAFFVQGISFEYTNSPDSEVTYKDNAIFFIDKIENSIFPQLNNRYEITFVSLSHCNPVDDYQVYAKLHLIHNIKFITEHKLDYFKGALYGVYDKVRFYPN